MIFSTLQRGILTVLVFGMAGTLAELILLQHYDEPAQLVPVFLLGIAIAVVAWHVVRMSTASRRALQATMLVFVIAGVVGMGLHFRGAAQFQLELNPALSNWDLTKKVMRAKAPPVLAPGVMMQLGLLGLAYTYFGGE